MTRALLVVTVGLAVASCGSSGAGSSSSPSSIEMPPGASWTEESGSSVTVEAQDNQFVPQFIEVRKGTTVTFTNGGRNRHNVLASEGGTFSDIQTDEFDPGMSASRTFDETGTFGYYCSLHGTKSKGMYGAIKVED